MSVGLTKKDNNGLVSFTIKYPEGYKGYKGFKEGVEYKDISYHMIKLHTKILDKINSHRSYDKKRNIYDELNFIDYECVFMKICNSDSKCCYCKIELKLINYKPYQQNQFSIDRIDSKLGHVDYNCCISCMGCNIRKGSKTSKQYMNILNYEKQLKINV